MRHLKFNMFPSRIFFFFDINTSHTVIKMDWIALGLFVFRNVERDWNLKKVFIDTNDMNLNSPDGVDTVTGQVVRGSSMKYSLETVSILAFDLIK